MLDSLLEKEVINDDVLMAYFLQALCWSVGAGLLEDGRCKFDRYVKFIAALSEKDPELGLAGIGEQLIHTTTTTTGVPSADVPWAL